MIRTSIQRQVCLYSPDSRTREGVSVADAGAGIVPTEEQNGEEYSKNETQNIEDIGEPKTTK